MPLYFSMLPVMLLVLGVALWTYFRGHVPRSVLRKTGVPYPAFTDTSFISNSTGKAVRGQMVQRNAKTCWIWLEDGHYCKKRYHQLKTMPILTKDKDGTYRFVETRVNSAGEQAAQLARTPW